MENEKLVINKGFLPNQSVGVGECEPSPLAFHITSLRVIPGGEFFLKDKSGRELLLSSKTVNVLAKYIKEPCHVGFEYQV